MTSNFETTFSVTEAMKQAESSGQPHNVVVVHNAPDQQVCDIHYGAYTVEESADSQGPYSTMSVKRRDEKTGDKSIVAVYHRKDVHAVYFVEGKQSSPGAGEVSAFAEQAGIHIRHAAVLGKHSDPHTKAEINELVQAAKRNVTRAEQFASFNAAVGIVNAKESK